MRTPSPGTAIALLALFVALGGTGYAVINSGVPDRQGVFHACVHKGNGKLRVVKAAGECRAKRKKFPGELAITWNQRGPQGAAGTPGVAGAPGANGTNGTNGANGTSVVVRMRGATEVTTTNTAQPVPISPSTWSQGAADSNDFLGQVVYDPPPGNECSGDAGGTSFPGTGIVTVKLDGTAIGSATMNTGAGSSATANLVLTPVFETGSVTDRTITVEASDSCGVPGGPAARTTTRFKVQSVAINVIALR